MQTKLAKASVQDNNGINSVADPSGHGRKRSYQFDHSSSTRVCGWVGWGSRPGPIASENRQGHVEAVSSHSQVSLQLDGAGDEIGGQS